MQNILIVKTSASGDVLRTTVLLHILKGNIYWITAGYNFPLFPRNSPGLTPIAAEAIPSTLFDVDFDLVINLEEDLDVARKLMLVRTRRLVGVYCENDALRYTSESAEWFDMSLISVLPSDKADALKKRNTRSYQEILFKMLGRVFSGQPYVMYKGIPSSPLNRPVIGIEKRVGSMWPNKGWAGYSELIQILQAENHDVKVFETRILLRQYLEDIGECSLVICGDTLAMHVALGYTIPCIALFNCTSPSEIYDYGILRKVESPLLFEVFYQRSYTEKVISAIPVESVYREIQHLMKMSQ